MAVDIHTKGFQNCSRDVAHFEVDVNAHLLNSFGFRGQGRMIPCFRRVFDRFVEEMDCSPLFILSITGCMDTDRVRHGVTPWLRLVTNPAC